MSCTPRFSGAPLSCPAARFSQWGRQWDSVAATRSGSATPVTSVPHNAVNGEGAGDNLQVLQLVTDGDHVLPVNATSVSSKVCALGGGACKQRDLT